MANGLQKILGYTYLAGIVEDVKTGIPEIMPKEFWSVTSDVPTDSGRYTRYAGQRKTLSRIEYGSPTVRTELEPVGVFDVKLLTHGNHINLNALDYQALRQWDGYAPMNRGKDEVDRQAVLFAQKRDNTKIAMVHSMLAKGAIYYDADGNILPSSSGAKVTVDYGVSAANQNQLNGIIAASWATATTNIPLHIEQLQARSLFLTGRHIEHAFYGENLPGYLASNNYAKEWLVRNPQMQAEWLNAPSIIPQGLFGLRWTPANRAFYVDQDGTTRQWFGADQVTWTPPIDMSVYEYMRGGYLVPSSFQPHGSLQAAMDSFRQVQGDFGYAVPLWNPISAQLHLGHVGMPIWKAPDALFISDVTP